MARRKVTRIVKLDGEKIATEYDHLLHDLPRGSFRIDWLKNSPAVLTFLNSDEKPIKVTCVETMRRGVYVTELKTIL